jgi:hypothetical protein
MQDPAEGPTTALEPAPSGPPAEDPVLQNNFEGATGALTKKQTRRGPKTSRGKEKVSQNALVFGINSDRPVTKIEVPEHWDYHVRKTIKSLGAKGYMEHRLAARVALYEWRLDRINNFETAAINKNLDGLVRDLVDLRESRARSGLEPKITADDAEHLMPLRVLPQKYDLEKVMRYETHLHRQRNQTLHELQALQALRRGEQAPLARLDITGSGS